MRFIQTDTTGIIPVYKPKGPSSHWVVNRVRQITGVRRVGHAGTLDPLADGVLVLGITREATRQLDKFVKQKKEYLAQIKLGVTSTTDDEAGEKTEIKVATPPPLSTIHDCIKKYVGEFEQVPPIYSAIKVQGESAYKKARRGEKINLKPKKRIIHQLEILEYSWPFLEIITVTGSGVYIRSLARDIGEDLSTGAYLTKLTRTKVGGFSLDDCWHLPEKYTWN